MMTATAQLQPTRHIRMPIVIEKDGTGIEKSGTGIEKSGTGIKREVNA